MEIMNFSANPIGWKLGPGQTSKSPSVHFANEPGCSIVNLTFSSLGGIFDIFWSGNRDFEVLGPKT